MNRLQGTLKTISLHHGVTWATGVDPKSGRPIESPTAYNGLQAVLVSPAPGGAHNWYPMAFNPTTGIVYLPARQGSFALHASLDK